MSNYITKGLLDYYSQDKLVRCTVFFVIELATRKVFFAPVKPQPDGDYMLQVARILTDYGDSILQGKGFLIHDRDPLYTEDFRIHLKNGGIESIKPPVRSPNLNEYYSNCTSLAA
jgi:hypothetical protein